MGDTNLAIDVVRELESAPGDLPRESCRDGELGTGLGLDGKGVFRWADIECVVFRKVGVNCLDTLLQLETSQP